MKTKTKKYAVTGFSVGFVAAAVAVWHTLVVSRLIGMIAATC